MPLKYFGRKTRDLGRPLWEIVLNLKNFGKGRLVVRSKYERNYPGEVTFFKILSVQPHVIEYPDNMHGNILVESVFRGRRRPEPVEIGTEASRADYRLVHKDEEASLYEKLKEAEAHPQKVIILPRTAQLPPLWKEILARENKTTPDKIPEIPLLYGEIDPYGTPRRVAEEGEEPSHRIGPGTFNPIHPEFYERVIWNREEAREKYCSNKPDPDFIYKDRKLTPLDIKKPSFREKSAAVASGGSK